MASNRKVMVLPGDGIGNEVMAANMKLIDWLAKHRSLSFDCMPPCAPFPHRKAGINRRKDLEASEAPIPPELRERTAQ